MDNQIKKTLYIKIEELKEERAKIEQIAAIVRKGGILAFPTETVFGIGVNAFNEEAVKQLFKIKKRAKEKSLTYYLYSHKEAGSIVKYIPRFAHLLMEKFCPGPLTLVFKKSSNVPDIITGGSTKVGIRIPKNNIILKILKMLNVPFVGTSANLSGRPSAVLPRHVLADLGGKIDVLVEGGDDPLGIESTVLDATSFPPRILRPGFISADSIKQVIGRAPMLSESRGAFNYSQYNPKAKIYLLTGNSAKFSAKLQEISKEFNPSRSQFYLTEETAGAFKGAIPVKIFGSQKDLKPIAAKLFDVLREIEDLEKDIIIIEGVDTSGLGSSITDRLFSASDKIIKA